MPSLRGSAAISPTGHYTGYVWVRNGLAPRELATGGGRALYYAAEPAMLVSRAVGGPTFEGLLLARHQLLDTLLAEAIERGEIGQVVEIAAGLSPRGRRFAERFGPGLTYIETDLPRMAERKRRLLDGLGGTGPHHRVVELDALREGGPGSLAVLAASLDSGIGTAIVTEGLLNYFDRDTVAAMWRRFARTLRRFPHGRYLADLNVAPHNRSVAQRLGAGLIEIVVRGRVHFHFTEGAEAETALRDTGFTHVGLHKPDTPDAGARLVHILDATT